MFSHKCTKCGAIYEDKDPDPYLCASCNEVRKRIAEEVNKRLAGRTPKEDSSFNALCNKFGRTIPSQSGGLATFFNARDLGI